MNARRAGRLWLIGGLLVIVVLITATYLLAIKPVYDDKEAKQSQAADMDVELVKLKKELAELKTKSNDLARYTAQLAAKKKQLPDSYDIPSYLRQLQASDGKVKVDNDAVTVSMPVEVTGSPKLVNIQVGLNATGTVDNLTKWLSRLLNQQPRATLIQSANLTEGDSGGWSVNLTVSLFCSKTENDDCTVAAG